jgi:hypothetical protein
VAIDIFGYRRMPAQQQKGYYPNLSLWGFGFVAGLCISFVGLLDVAVGKLWEANCKAPAESLALTQNLTLLLLPAVLLAVAIWAITRLSQRE